MLGKQPNRTFARQGSRTRRRRSRDEVTQTCWASLSPRSQTYVPFLPFAKRASQPALTPLQDGSLRLVFGDQAERKTLDAKQDFEDVSKLTKAEMARFDKEKVEDFKKAVEDYVEGMLVRQREVGSSSLVRSSWY